MGFIYSITNEVNGKNYIGKTTKTATERLQRHFVDSRYLDRPLHRAIRKYGRDNFTIKILEETDDLDAREIFWINKIEPSYNLTKGGEGGDTSKSPKFIESMKRRNFHGSKNPMWGKKRNIPVAQLKKAHKRAAEANKCPVICDGILYSSVGEAQRAYPGCNIRKKLDNPKHPEFYRLRPKTIRK